MRMGHPETWFLVLLGGVLASVAATLIAGYFLRRRRLARLGSEAARAGTVRARAPGLGAVKGVVYLAGAGALLFAVARPQHGGRERLVRQVGLDVAIAVDHSKSMLAQDVTPSRIDRVRIEIDRLLGALEGNRVAAVAFAGDAIAFPLSTDTALARTFFRNFDPATMQPPGTAIGRAVRKSERLLAGGDRRGSGSAGAAGADRGDDRARIIIVFTDGEDHEGDPVAAARGAERNTRARVFVVFVGEMGGSTIPIRDPVTGELRLHYTPSGQVAMSEITPQVEDNLRKVASSRDPGDPDSGDRYFYRLAASGSVAEQIAADIGKLRKTEMEARKVTLYDELYWIALAPAVVLLAVEAALPVGFERRRRRKR